MIMPLAVVTILVVGVALFFTQTYLKQFVDDTFIKFKVHHLTTVYNLKMDHVLSEIKHDGIEVANSQKIIKYLQSPDPGKRIMPQDVKDELSELKLNNKLENIYVADKKSRNYYDENGFVKVIDPSDKESKWFLNTLNSKKKFLINADSDITGSLHIWSDVIVGDVNDPIGLAGCGMDISNIYDLAMEDFSNESTNVIIMNGSNMIAGSSGNAKLINQPIDTSLLSKQKISAIKSALNSHKILTEYNLNKEHRYLLFIPIEGIDLTVIVDFSKMRFLNSVHGVYNRVIIGGIIIMFLLFIIGGFTFTYIVSRPLKEMASTVSTYDYKMDFPLDKFKHMGYEVEMISEAFNKSSIMLRQTIQKYKSSEELLKNIIDATDDLIFFKNRDLKYIGCNSAYERWSKKTADEIVGLNDYEIYPPEIAKNHREMDRYVLKEGKTSVFEESFDGEYGEVVLHVKKSPFYDKDGNIDGIVVVARDITDMKKMKENLEMLNTTLEEKVQEKTQELQKTNKELENHLNGLVVLNSKLKKTKEEALQAAQARSNFISSISHELRTPLNAIINFTDQVIEDFDEMIEDKELQEENRVFLNRVLVNSKHLLHLINDLLEFTKAEAGKMEYSLEESDINEIVHAAYNNTYSLLTGTKVTYNVNVYKEPLIAHVDFRRFLQILLNLISNAIKFTNEGFVEIRTYPQNGDVVVEVEDSGKGIPIEHQKTIFDPFVQVNSSDYGTGLGLGLVKRMCDDMNIKISLRSDEGEGTLFQLVLKKSET